METIYGILTKGVIESRKSFLYGPFCIVYGIAALFLIYPLKKYKNKNEELFIYGMVIGCAVEYFSSLIAELFFHIKWWDYSNEFLNINGRTCIYYALLWGILSILLINYIHPFLEKIVETLICKYKKIIKYSVSITSLFLLFDAMITCIALNNFTSRVEKNFNVDFGVNNLELNILNIPNNVILLNYPNISAIDIKTGELVYFDTILNTKDNYYYKIIDK